MISELDSTPVNFFISYPRSGWHWFLIRSAVFLRRCLGINFHPGAQENVIKKDLITIPPYPGHIIDMNCAGYDFFNGTSGNFDLKETVKDITDKGGVEVFINFRDPRSILPSYYNFERYYMKNTAWDNVNLFQWAKSEGGIARICNYANNMQILIDNCPVPVHYMFYGDNFRVDSVHMIPKILGIDYQISYEDAQYIYDATNMEQIKTSGNIDISPSDISKNGIQGMYRKGTYGSYKGDLSVAVLNYINKYLDDHCTFEPFRKRYIYE